MEIERTIPTRRTQYIERIIKMFNKEIMNCENVSEYTNTEINAILEALPIVILSVVYSCQLSKTMKLSLLEYQKKMFECEITRVTDEEDKQKPEEGNQEVPNSQTS